MSPKKKVLIYNTSFFHISQTFIYQQVSILADDYDIDLIASKFINPHNYSIHDFNQIEIKRSYGLLDRLSNKILDRALFTFESHKKLNKLFEENRYKAVHAHFGTKALEILPYARKYNVPLVVSFHGADASRMLKQSSYVKKLHKLFDYSSAIIISSMHMAKNLNLDLEDEKVHFIPYGVNPDFFNGLSDKVKDNKIRILHSGRIVGKKGVPDLIRVFSELVTKYPNVELHLVGDGEELSECKELVSKIGIEKHVTFYGSVPQEKVKNMINNADIFVLNSRIGEDGDMEGTPVTILEAMCMGKAVVSTRHAGIPYVIENAENGLLANEYANSELKDSIELLINNPELRKKLGEKAKSTVHNSYTTQIMETKLKNVFRSL
jgi:colanic acid/amylovoran biosynthesis glycosyltransferase